ncbi:RNA polymerase, sigma-24 subunit, ECF subfamily [Catenulispora acidiphila DSM 44928]|uniref:RNA polymerase, sigma-24 subunit, ECF subfamily n=1 Tax=Catenulispora acidiphila (strain DSM 44928 / JCM 14897 / NBRC 102108 / NRRL B-24433 / ID139908) TaxID=479433 RepID=C7PY67_CATAD|nr:sigma-70 family RNA polymerase sigma factor [Catenulispora acidiphila]ACU75357.1 RNA polymerase, sigma-24 subunit, ECF subfamily [Catenulispora acidiphila DSM 44928]
MDRAGELFEKHRATLSAAAYRMLGSRADADDVLQEAWLRWSRVDHASVADPGAYLFRLVTRQAIDELRRIRARREVHAAHGLPDTPAAGPGVGLRPVEEVEAGLLVVLETLAPTERAVFLLHDVFGFSHAEIAAIVGRTERAVQQMAYRARRHIRARRPRFRPTPGEHRATTDRFLAAAALGGDLVGYGSTCAST